MATKTQQSTSTAMEIHMGDRFCMKNSYGWLRLYEKFIWVVRFVWEIRLYVRNSRGFPRLYEKFMSVFGLKWEVRMLLPSVREIHVGVQAVCEKFIWVFSFVWEIRLYMRNSHGFPRLYEKFMSVFGLKWEVRMASPVCARNSCRCSGCVCEKFIWVFSFVWEIPFYMRKSHGFPSSVREIHVGVQVCTRNLAL
jgi:hypothetical protein